MCISAWDNCLRQPISRLMLLVTLSYYGNFIFLSLNKVVCNLGVRGDAINGLNISSSYL